LKVDAARKVGATIQKGRIELDDKRLNYIKYHKVLLEKVMKKKLLQQYILVSDKLQDEKNFNGKVFGEVVTALVEIQGILKNSHIKIIREDTEAAKNKIESKLALEIIEEGKGVAKVKATA